MRLVTSVTIAIGLISRAPRRDPAIILASDSQTTYSEGGPKSLDAQKLSMVEFADAEILVAQAGSADLGAKAIEIMQRKAKGVSLENDQTVEKTAEASVREIRRHLKDENDGIICSEEGWKRLFFEEEYFVLLIAYFFENQPHLFTVDLDRVLAIPADRDYKAIGCGASMGEFFIREWKQSDSNFAFALPIAVSVVEKVIPNVEGCGQPSWAGMVNKMPEEIAAHYKPLNRPYKKSLVQICNRDQIDPICDKLKNLESQIGDSRNKLVQKILPEAFQQYMSDIQIKNRILPPSE